MNASNFPVPPSASQEIGMIGAALAQRRSEAARKAWATRRRQGWASSPQHASGSAAARAALARFEREAAATMPDWHAAALELKRALTTSRSAVVAIERPKKAPRALPVPAFPDYAVDRVTSLRLRWPSPVLVVTFADGEIVRAPAVSLLKKPVNLGRGLRVAIAFYQSRICRRKGLRYAPGTRLAVPEITACICEDTGEAYDAALCNAHTENERAAQDWRLRPSDPRGTSEVMP